MFDGAAHAFDAVRGEIVHHHDIAGPERWREYLFDIGQEALAIHGAVQEQRRSHSGEAQSRGKGCHFPVAMRHAGPAAFAARTAPVPPRHLGVRTRFVNEDETLRLEIGLVLEPRFAAPYDIGAVLFVGMRRLFLTVIPWRSKKRQSVPIPKRAPRRARRSCSSTRVMSLRSAIVFMMKA